MVDSTLFGSVVAKMNTTCAGGSSKVLSSALEAAADSMCTSSSRYTLRRPALTSAAFSVMSRMWFTELLDAASSSMRSIEVPAAIARQLSQLSHGSPSAVSSPQLSALAIMRAVDVLPVPRGPLSRYACPTRSWLTALRKARTKWGCPTTSANRCGRNLR